MKQIAYCHASGQVGFGMVVPNGALPIGYGEIDDITAQCRLAYDNETWLVPGIPEAGEDQQKALDALMRFRDRLVAMGKITTKLPRHQKRRPG